MNATILMYISELRGYLKALEILSGSSYSFGARCFYLRVVLKIL